MHDSYFNILFIERFHQSAYSLNTPKIAIVMQDYISSYQNMLSLQKGDQIMIYQISSLGWCLAKNGEKQGYCPMSNVLLNDSQFSSTELYPVRPTLTNPISHFVIPNFSQSESCAKNPTFVIETNSVNHDKSLKFSLYKPPRSQLGLNQNKRVLRQCAECDTTTTPEWRTGPSGDVSLCNACGLRWQKREKKIHSNPKTNARMEQRIPENVESDCNKEDADHECGNKLSISFLLN